MPPRIYEEFGCKIPDDMVESQTECFVSLCQDNPKAGTNIIAEYIKYFNRLAEKGEISPNMVPGYVKPIL